MIGSRNRIIAYHHMEKLERTSFARILRSIETDMSKFVIATDIYRVYSYI